MVEKAASLPEQDRGKVNLELVEQTRLDDLLYDGSVPLASCRHSLTPTTAGRGY
jgi:hypothetical protein